MNTQVLTIEQMQELIKLGIDISKASMIWYPKMAVDIRTGKGYVESHYLTINRIDSENFWNTRIGKETMPTFTLQDILNILNNVREYVWMLNESGVILEDLRCNEIHREHHDNLIQAAFKMLVWCKQNNYV